MPINSFFLMAASIEQTRRLWLRIIIQRLKLLLHLVDVWKAGNSLTLPYTNIESSFGKPYAGYINVRKNVPVMKQRHR